MKIGFTRELKSPRLEVATITMEWNPSDHLEDNAAAIVAAVIDMAEQYITMATRLKGAQLDLNDGNGDSNE